MKLTPLFDRVIVLPVPEGKVSKGGLLIPAVAERSTIWRYGDVTAVGPGRHNADGAIIPMSVKVGDVVAYPRQMGQLIPITNDDGDEVPHVVLREPELLGIVHGLARETSITGIDGRLLSMMPTSRGLPDVAYKNEEELQVAERAGFVEPGDYPPDEFAPGDGPVELGVR
jgi:chaperonin GroES